MSSPSIVGIAVIVGEYVGIMVSSTGEGVTGEDVTGEDVTGEGVDSFTGC